MINLDAAAVEDWLSPQGRSYEELQQVLDRRDRPYYERQVLAA